MHRSALVVGVLVFSFAACSSDKGMSGGTGGAIVSPGAGGATVPASADAGPLGTGGAAGLGGATTIPAVGTGGSPVIGTGGAVADSGGAVTNLDAPVAGAIGGTSGPDAASGGAVGPDAGAGGTVGPVSCDKDLSGTWDLFTTAVGTGIVRGTFTIKKEGFSLATRTAELTYNGTAPSAMWKYTPPWYYYDSTPTTRTIAVQNTPASVNSGSVPIALGGHWVLQSASETCTLDVAADKVTGKCTGRPTDEKVGGEDWPWEVLASPENRLTYTIARSGALASQFGDFGGTWAAQSDSGSGQGCNIKLDGNTASTNCKSGNSFNGTMHLTVGSDCVASGVTPSGLEVSARRR